MKSVAFLALMASLAVSGVVAQTTANCLATPSDASCASFVLPDETVKADIEGLCTQMPFMPGCSIYKSCQAASKTDQWCTPFSVLADICAVDMPNMRDCKNYAMPDMHQCAAWKTMCSASSPSAALGFDKSEYCAAGVGSDDMNPPAMRMFFHGGFADYVLFETWVPRNLSQYVGTWFALFFLTLFYQTIATYHTSLEAKWAEELAEESELKAKSESTVPLSGAITNSILLSWVYLWRKPWTMTEVKQNVIRAVLTFIETTLGYALMLVTMTFNVPLFFAVILGLTVGSVVFSRQRAMVMGKSAGGNNSSSNSGCAGCG
ncbi:hypothetical protein BGZ94_007763 [Podila epigama]|nr:hypothetical protein BGZ94_007763 [Podila epigama]